MRTSRVGKKKFTEAQHLLTNEKTEQIWNIKEFFPSTKTL